MNQDNKGKSVLVLEFSGNISTKHHKLCHFSFYPFQELEVKFKFVHKTNFGDDFRYLFLFVKNFTRQSSLFLLCEIMPKVTPSLDVEGGSGELFSAIRICKNNFEDSYFERIRDHTPPFPVC